MRRVRLYVLVIREDSKTLCILVGNPGCINFCFFCSAFKFTGGREGNMYIYYVRVVVGVLFVVFGLVGSIKTVILLLHIREKDFNVDSLKVAVMISVFDIIYQFKRSACRGL